MSSLVESSRDLSRLIEESEEVKDRLRSRVQGLEENLAMARIDLSIFRRLHSELESVLGDTVRPGGPSCLTPKMKEEVRGLLKKMEEV